MKVNLYIEGGVTPAYFDYALDADGVLWPSKRPIHGNGGTIYIMLEQFGEGPTLGQLATLRTITTINPDWVVTYYFPFPEEE